MWPRLTMSTFLSFQVTSASLEAPTAIHPPAREPEPWRGTTAESLLRGPKTTQELGPARCQQSSQDGARPDLTGTGRCRFCISRNWSGSCHPWQEGGPQSQSGLKVPPHKCHFWSDSLEAESPILEFGFFFNVPQGLIQAVVSISI